MVPHTLEGTWEEIARHAPELAGHRVRVTVLDDAATSLAKPTLEDLMADYVGSVTSPEPHNLSERVDEVFGEIMDEKYPRSGKQ